MSSRGRVEVLTDNNVRSYIHKFPMTGSGRVSTLGLRTVIEPCELEIGRRWNDHCQRTSVHLRTCSAAARATAAPVLVRSIAEQGAAGTRTRETDRTARPVTRRCVTKILSVMAQVVNKMKDQPERPELRQQERTSARHPLALLTPGVRHGNEQG